jgi:hypothetical protein
MPSNLAKPSARKGVGAYVYATFTLQPLHLQDGVLCTYCVAGYVVLIVHLEMVLK